MCNRVFLSLALWCLAVESFVIAALTGDKYAALFCGVVTFAALILSIVTYHLMPPDPQPVRGQRDYTEGQDETGDDEHVIIPPPYGWW